MIYNYVGKKNMYVSRYRLYRGKKSKKKIRVFLAKSEKNRIIIFKNKLNNGFKKITVLKPDVDYIDNNSKSSYLKYQDQFIKDLLFTVTKQLLQDKHITRQSQALSRKTSTRVLDDNENVDSDYLTL